MKTAITAAIFAVASVSAGAQSTVDDFADSLASSHRLVHIDGRPAPDEIDSYVDSVRQIISAFYYEQFRNYQDPEAPYFLFLSKDASLAMGMGGAVRMRAYYDWGGAMPAAGFAPYLIPMSPSPQSMRHFDTTPSGTCLFFRVIGRNRKPGSYQLYIEANFTGYQGRDFKLKKAYAVINDFTVGYAASTFSDPAAVPPTVDAQGPSNKITPTAVLVRYMPVLRDRWVLGVSAETPSANIAADNTVTAVVDNFMPDFAAMVQYQWERGQHVRLSGIVRSLGYRDLVAGRNHSLAGWGVQLSAVAHPWYPVTVYATAVYGRGFQSLGSDLMIGAYDLLDMPECPGRMYAPAAMGWNIGVQYNFSHSLFVSANVSQMRLKTRHPDPGEYRYGLCAAANVFWYLTPRISIAAEFDWGLRRNVDGSHRQARRLGAMCQFSF